MEAPEEVSHKKPAFITLSADRVSASSQRRRGPGPLVGHVKTNRLAKTKNAFAFDPGGHAAPPLGRTFEKPPFTGVEVVDLLGRQDAGTVLHVDHQGGAPFGLEQYSKTLCKLKGLVHRHLRDAALSIVAGDV